METTKARLRRLRERFFEKYIRPDLKGIDIGCGDDPVVASPLIKNSHRSLGLLFTVRINNR